MAIRWSNIVVFFFLVGQEVAFGQPDPCTSHTNIVEPLRSTGYVAQLPDYDHLICDNQLTTGWYRFYSNAGWEMPTSCPPMYHCGTHIPLWLNGTHPSATAGIVTREICGNVPSGGCCGYKDTVRVKQCTTASSLFYVYELQPTRGCSVAYCAGTRTPCPPHKWSPSGFEPGCKEMYPLMTQNPTLSLPIVKPFTFEFNCHVNFNSTRSDVGFDIEWLFDGIPDRNISTRHISGLQRDSSIDQKYLVGHLGQAISCRASSHLKSTPGRRGPGIVSKDYWMGIKFEPSSLHVGTKEPPKEVKLISTIPMVCDKQNAPSCGIDLYLEPNNHVLRTTRSCTVHIGPKNWNPLTHQAVAKFDVLAERNPLLKDHTLVLAFNKTKSWDAPPIFNNYHIPYLPVYTKDSPTGVCSCIGDPHCITMDKSPVNMTATDISKNISLLWSKHRGLWANIYKRGEFVMYNSTKRPFEVQIRNWQCGKVTCICAVAAREGNDIVRIDMCHGSYGHTFPKLTIPNKNITSHGTVIHKDSTGKEWVIEFPSGAVVKVTVAAGRYMNAYVTAPEDDYNATQGLCGTFDGDYTNDQTGKDGTVYPWSAIPNTFFESWRVPVGSSLFDKPPAPDPKLDNDIYFCNCDQKKKIVDCSLKNKAVRPAMHGLQVYNPQSQKPGHSGKKRSSGPNYSPDADTEIRYYFDYGLFGGASATANFPTASGITHYNATKMCLDAIQNSPTLKECTLRTGLLFVAEIGTCIEDIRLTDDLEYIHSAVETAIVNCQEYIFKNASFYDNTGKPPAFISSDLCPLQCSGHGMCVKGVCHCNSGYTGDSCSIDSRKPPTLHNIISSDMMNPASSICDIQQRPCQRIYVVGNNIQDHSALRCRLEEMEFTQSHFMPTGRTFETPVIYESVYNVLCSMQTQSQIQGKDVVGYHISLSNDGHAYSNKIQAYIVDTQCMSCDSNGRCSIKPTTCLIDGKCRNGQEPNPTDHSMICQPATNQHQWTAINAPSASPTQTGGKAEARLDIWTLSGTGCTCKSNETSLDCACCDIDACQCPGPHQHQCANCNHMANCGTLQPVGDNGLDGYTVSKTDCPCNFDTTRGDCACCQNGGCQCDQPHHNQCVRCGSSGQCGAKQWLFGDPPMIGK